MIIFFGLGVLIGAVSVIFFLQNTIPVSVLFLSWQLEEPLAIILVMAFLGGVIMMALFSLPTLVVDWLEAKQLRKRINQLEDELSTSKAKEPSIVLPTNSVPPSSDTTMGIY